MTKQFSELISQIARDRRDKQPLSCSRDTATVEHVTSKYDITEAEYDKLADKLGQAYDLKAEPELCVSVEPPIILNATPKKQKPKASPNPPRISPVTKSQMQISSETLGAYAFNEEDVDLDEALMASLDALDKKQNEFDIEVQAWMDESGADKSWAELIAAQTNRVRKVWIKRSSMFMQEERRILKAAKDNKVNDGYFN